jgi:hypothetical protein
MAKLTTKEARALAEQFYRISKELGNYRFARWNELTRDERREIESLEWSLLNASADFAASALDVALDDIAPVVKRVAGSARRMKSAIRKAKRPRDVLAIAAAAVKLSAAIVSGSPSAIAKALERAIKLSS